MPRNQEHPHVETSPHRDGKREGLINNPLASPVTGIKTNANAEFGMEKNPFNFKPKRDKEMEKFEDLIGGTPQDK